MNSIDAIKFFQVGGHDGVIEIRTYRNGSTGVVVIRDNGEGIPRENVDKIFRPGFTTKGPTHKGLGLSIARQIVERHNGQIAVESELQKGTTLTLKFPLINAGDDHER
jgi:two-component system NtrC family sensor kinase